MQVRGKLHTTSENSVLTRRSEVYAWYEQAGVCYVYLSDVGFGSDEGTASSSFHNCRWFSRGWTLQELLAPRQLLFFTKDWDLIGTKADLASDIEAATGIQSAFLVGTQSIFSASIARRMSWQASRSTTRSEDLAYCLMGLFDVHMPMLYGERTRAFIRLQEEIMKGSDDQSLFVWRARCDDDRHGLLADSPAAFRDSGDIVPLRGLSSERDRQESHAMTNRGLRIELPCRQVVDTDARMMQLDCQSQLVSGYIRIYLFPTGESTNHFARGRCEEFALFEQPLTDWRSVYVRQSSVPSAFVEAALHHIKVMGFITPDPSSPKIERGVYLDILGNGEKWNPWSPSSQPRPIRIAKQAGRLTAYLILPPKPLGRAALLIGSDELGRLAFDVWSPTPDAELTAFITDATAPSARDALPKFFVKAFTPQPPGTCMSLRSYDIQVKVEPIIESVHVGLGLFIYCSRRSDNDMKAAVLKMLDSSKKLAVTSSSGETSTPERTVNAKGFWKGVTGTKTQKS